MKDGFSVGILFKSPHIAFKDAHKDYIAVTAARSSFTQQNWTQVKKYMTLAAMFLMFFSKDLVSNKAFSHFWL